MTQDQRQRVEELFDELRPLNGAQRAPRLAEVDDLEVRAEVESLLLYMGNVTGGNLNTAIGGVMQAAASAGAFGGRTVGPGTRLDHYRIERRLGQGGMGDVYEAVRDDDFHKRVAIKIVRYGLDSEFANRQFAQERQMLAGLEHPYIARLLDGGNLDSCPYLVLEFVEGTPIDVYCKDLPREAVLSLFLKVCEAVTYAHRKLIVHRDLKPANIMVTPAGEPKLLDFGIAKLLDPSSDATITRFTALTPQYASPEQIRGEAITTSTDVYSLAIVFYELLAGRKPYEVAANTASEMERLICETESPRLGVSEDLDNILAMALRKDAARRYPSVEHFAADIERSLAHRPVHARPDTVRYRAGKFFRRNRTAVAAAAALLLATAGGVGATVYQARLASQRFELVRKLAHSFVFDYDDALAKLDGATDIREKMVGTAFEYLNTLSASAGSDARLLAELAAAYQKVGDVQGYPTRSNLGHADRAVASYWKAAAIHDRIAVASPAERYQAGSFYVDFAHLLRLTGDFDGARRMGESAKRTLESAAAERPSDDAVQVDLSSAWCVLADVDGDTHHNRASLEKFTRCDAIVRQVLKRSRTHAILVRAMQARAGLGAAQVSAGRLTEAAATFDEYEAILGELLRDEPENPNLRRGVAVLGQWRAGLSYDDAEPSFGDPARAVPYARQYLEVAKEMVRRDPKNDSAQFSLAVAYFRLADPLKFSDPAAALAAARESVRLFDVQIAAGRRTFLFLSRRPRAVRRLSEALILAGRTEEAAVAAAEALARQRKIVARDPRDLRGSALMSMMLITAAQAAAARRDLPGAAAYLIEAEALAAKTHAGNGELTSLIPLIRARTALATHWRIEGDDAQSRRWSEDAARLWREFPDRNEYVRRQTDALARGGQVR